jgi:hypothetical protein
LVCDLSSKEFTKVFWIIDLDTVIKERAPFAGSSSDGVADRPIGLWGQCSILFITSSDQACGSIFCSWQDSIREYSKAAPGAYATDPRNKLFFLASVIGCTLRSVWLSKLLDNQTGEFKS